MGYHTRHLLTESEYSHLQRMDSNTQQMLHCVWVVMAAVFYHLTIIT